MAKYIECARATDALINNTSLEGYDLEEAVNAICAIPAADVRHVVRGKWTMHSDYPDRLICSECGTQFDVWHWEAKQMHFCHQLRGRHEGGKLMYDELVKELRGEYGYDTRKDIRVMKAAADAIDELQDALLLMVLQYCTTDDGLLHHSFMSAGENAFAVLGLENGQQADPLWDMVLVQKPLKEK